MTSVLETNAVYNLDDTGRGGSQNQGSSYKVAPAMLTEKSLTSELAVSLKCYFTCGDLMLVIRG